MNIAIILLAAILIFILWSIYNISEGFQTAPSTGSADTDMKCSVLKNAQEIIKKRYDDAVKINNTPIINSSKESMDSIKALMSNTGC
jgi:hypothetical protein